jgi:ribose transport system substrate-binding protein
MSRKLVLFISLVAILSGVLGVSIATAQDEPVHFVGFVPPAFTSPFHVAMADGAVARAEQLGWRIEVQAPASEGDFAGQVTIVQQLIELGVEAISVNPIQTEAMVTGVQVANEAGVPFFFHNFITPLQAEDIEVTSYIGYDQWGGAAALAMATCEYLAARDGVAPEEATGEVYILLGIESIFSHRRTGGFKAGLEAGCPGVTVAGEQTAEWLRDRGSSVATAALQQFPGIDVFYGNSDEMAIGAALAAETLGLQIGTDYFAVGIDGNEPTLDLIAEGGFTATLGVDPFRMGVTVIDAMNAVFNGAEVPQVILTPSTVVNADNLEAYIAGETWTQPVAGFPEEDNDMPTVPEEMMGMEMEDAIPDEYEGSTMTAEEMEMAVTPES